MSVQKISIDIYLDGNQYCATSSDFINLQESPVGFGDTALEAIQHLLEVFPIEMKHEAATDGPGVTEDTPHV